MNTHISQPPAPGPKPATLSADDARHHAHLIQQAKQAAQYQQFIATTKGALESWGAYLTQTYGITPQDRVQEDGTIERGRNA